MSMPRKARIASRWAGRWFPTWLMSCLVGVCIAQIVHCVRGVAPEWTSPKVWGFVSTVALALCVATLFHSVSVASRYYRDR